jgi:hypothetical protein
MRHVKTWRVCCPYPQGVVVEHGGALWVAIRRTGKGETPGDSGAWERVPASEMAAAVDPRAGQGL